MRKTDGIYGKNKKMNNETYALRRKVIEIIYAIKKEVELPRIEVRITENNSDGILGSARTGHNVIWIPESTILDASLFHIVAHEIGHAAFGAAHNDKCKLMRPSLSVKGACSESEAIKILSRM